ncbi:hypothetical protein ON010_g11159 [Phytophthora cinnamomi]|nr:hypothetical protein ON010_g11159 [Phytophthora cinnamomi]
MAEKKQQQLPLPTPASEPGFVGEGDGEYVTVLTPDNKAAALTPNPAGADFDPNGLRMNVWSVDLHDADLRTAYYWWVCCCRRRRRAGRVQAKELPRQTAGRPPGRAERQGSRREPRPDQTRPILLVLPTSADTLSGSALFAAFREY